MTALFWHRRDLRVADNVGLARAVADGPVVPVFVLDSEVLEHAGPPRVAALADALEALREAYRDRGSDLLVEAGDPTAVLPALAADHGADAVYWNRDYSGLARERDRAVRAALADDGVAVETADDALLHAPGSITTNAGEHYSVFSYFWKKWRDRETEPPASPPDGDALAERSGEPLPPLDATPDATVESVTPEAARERLADFCAGDVYRYADDRDYPARDGTARLGAHLSFGTVGPRTVYAATADAMAEAPDEDGRESVTEFRRQLAWREFYAHVLAHQPRLVTESLADWGRAVDWRNDREEFAAWTRGETGFPLVDAGMRQLREEAWMHNRVRMVVASFLTRDLLVDWRWGYDWFRERLVDHDPANDAGGWQWAAGTGVDPQPYFRVFNPALQCERFDPEASYVHRHVPELRDVEPTAVHEWPDLPAEERATLAPEYLDPVVDHAERREAAIAAFEAARD